jgi:hypothetical protein
MFEQKHFHCVQEMNSLFGGHIDLYKQGSGGKLGISFYDEGSAPFSLFIKSFSSRSEQSFSVPARLRFPYR